MNFVFSHNLSAKVNKTCPCGDTASFWRTLSWSLTCPFQFASFQIHPDSHQYLFSSSPPHWCPVFSNSMGSSLYGYSSTLTSPNCPQGIHIVVPSWVPCHSPEDSQVSLGLRVWFSSGDPQSPLAKLLPPHSKKKKKKFKPQKPQMQQPLTQHFPSCLWFSKGFGWVFIQPLCPALLWLLFPQTLPWGFLS